MVTRTAVEFTRQAINVFTIVAIVSVINREHVAEGDGIALLALKR